MVLWFLYTGSAGSAPVTSQPTYRLVDFGHFFDCQTLLWMRVWQTPQGRVHGLQRRTKKNLSSLRGHAITSISTSYQVKFTVSKSVPSANPPYNQYHLLSGRSISGIECNFKWHFLYEATLGQSGLRFRISPSIAEILGWRACRA